MENFFLARRKFTQQSRQIFFVSLWEKDPIAEQIPLKEKEDKNSPIKNPFYLYLRKSIWAFIKFRPKNKKNQSKYFPLVLARIRR